MPPIEQQPMAITSGNAVNFVVAILRDALKSIGSAGNQSSERQFQLIAADSDNFLALREQGASRRKILSCPGNPFEDRNIVTSSGLFSALYFGARSFRSPALLHTPEQHLRTMFTGPEHVRQYESGIQNLLQQSPELFGTLTNTQRKHFFHHHKMYGQSNPLPDDWPYRLWKAVELTNWEALLSQGSADCQALHKLWTKPQSKSKKNETEVPSKFLPRMGRLALYLLCADLSHTSAVAMPSIESLGEMVASVNLGAVNGLQTLGLVPADLTGQALKGTVKTQFVELFREISERLSEEEKDRMGFDGVTWCWNTHCAKWADFWEREPMEDGASRRCRRRKGRLQKWRIMMQRMMKKTMKKDLLGRRRRQLVGKGRRGLWSDMVYNVSLVLILFQLTCLPRSLSHLHCQNSQLFYLDEDVFHSF